MKQPELRDMLQRQDARALAEFLTSTHPATAANLLAQLSVPEVWQVLAHTDAAHQAAIVHHLPHPKKLAMVLAADRARLAPLLDVMPTSDRVDLLKDVQPELLDEELVPLVDKAQREDIRRQLSLPNDSAAEVMSTDYAWVPDGLTAGQALARLRHQAPNRHQMFYVYVLDAQRHLVGVVDLPQLILAPASAKLGEFTERNVFAVPLEMNKEVAAQKMAELDVVALPVVDGDKRLVGILTHSALMDVVIDAATEDILRMGAIEPGALDLPYMATPFGTLVKKRATWLIILFVGEMLTATAMGYFEVEIEKAVVLAMFVPLVISSGGNSGSQAATLIIRAMALQEIRLRDWWLVMRREIYSGLALGLILGTIGFFRIAVWSMFGTMYGEHWFLIALTVGISLVGIVLWGTFSGSMLPMLLRRIGLDPATSSAPFVATLVDVTGLVIYFTVAIILLTGTVLK